MKTVIIVQARMASTRLPGKVMLEVHDRPLLEYQLERLGRVADADSVVVATTDQAQDDRIADLCLALGVAVFRGDEHDVLERYSAAAAWIGADRIVRVNADCPLIDPSLVSTVIARFESAQPEADYASNILKPTFPIGMHTEIFSRAALESAHREAVDPVEREHVTPFIYRHPGRFVLVSIENEVDLSDLRLTVDYPEDFALINKILSELYPLNPQFEMMDVVELLRLRPDWRSLNAGLEDKRHTL